MQVGPDKGHCKGAAGPSYCHRDGGEGVYASIKGGRVCAAHTVVVGGGGGGVGWGGVVSHLI